MKWACEFILLVLLCAALDAAQSCFEQPILMYYGAGDASAAVWLSKNLFIVANDENNVLRIYRTTQGGMPVSSRNLTEFLDVDPEHPEADIEGAARINNRIFWITSHGRNKNGKIREARHRFFATDIRIENNEVNIEPVGTSCKTLAHSLIRADTLQSLLLDKATSFAVMESKRLAPKESGLNIEALCACADGKIMYIGFRNPRPGGKALVVPLKNPGEVVEKAALPIFGQPLLWNFNGLGIRSMEYSQFHKAYFIIAGPHNGDGGFYLYRWSGQEDTSPKLERQICSQIHKFTPEALVCFKESQKLFVLSDDDALEVEISDSRECLPGEILNNGKCLNKHLRNPAKRHFRATWLKP
ncbi:DUF3616 domain-containing protein [Planctomycetota bacterium]